MTTALQIIDRAYSLLGYKAAGETLSADDSDYALGALNSMVDAWNTQKLFILSVSNITATVTAQSATIGTGLTFDTARPTVIESGAFSRVSGIDYPLVQLDREAYERIPQKASTSDIPEFFYYDQAETGARVWFYPVPSSVSVYLPVSTYLTGFADLSTDYTLAKGYRRALEYSLAEELAPGIKPLDPLIMKQAVNARRSIKRTNAKVPSMSLGYSGYVSNIVSGV